MDAKEELVAAPSAMRGFRRPRICMLAAAVCLLGAVAIYAACVLAGGIGADYLDPGYVLARNAFFLVFRLLIVFFLGRFIAEGLGRWASEPATRAHTLAVLFLPLVLAVVARAADPSVVGWCCWWVGEVFWPVAAAVLAYHFLMSRGDACLAAACVYGVVCLLVVSQLALLSRWEFDYACSFFLLSAAIAGACLAYLRWRRPRRRVLVCALVVAVAAAVLFSVAADDRFYEILDESGYAWVWISDRLESLSRFLTLNVTGWDCVAVRNELFMISTVAGAPAGLAYVVLSAASAVFMVLACEGWASGRTSHPEGAGGDFGPSLLVIRACGISYAAFVAVALGCNLLNINTTISPSGLGVVPLSLMLLICLICRCNEPKSPEITATNVNLSDESAVGNTGSAGKPTTW